MTTATFKCEHCGDEMGAVNLDDGEYYDLAEKWDEDHAHCGKSVELTTWQALVKEGTSRRIVHGYDASKVIPIPRPSWSDPDRDILSSALTSCCYRSPIAAVAVTHARGWEYDDQETVVHAAIDVSAKLFGNGVAMVGMTINKAKAPETGVSATPDEARRIARAMLAAADLAESEVAR